jgi:integrase
VIGGKRLADVRAEDVERVYSVMTAAGKSAATVAHVRRTLSKAFGDAHKRGYIPRNPVPLAAAPKVEDVEVEPLTVDEARRVLDAADGVRNGAAFVIALSLGLRRGEVLELGWDDVDLDAGTLRVRHQLQRHPYRHGCGGGCGKSAKSCPDRFGGGLHLVPVKSAAGRRSMSLPVPLAVQLRAHRKQQLAERMVAGTRWRDQGLVFVQPDGAPVDPDAHGRDWRALLADAGVRPARLHDARHTAATTLLVQGVDPRVVMDLLGWSTSAVANRYQHVVPELRQLAAERVSAALWGPTATGTATDRR